jgi:predicted alpha/beta hydrolase
MRDIGGGDLAEAVATRIMQRDHRASVGRSIGGERIGLVVQS